MKQTFLLFLAFFWAFCSTPSVWAVNCQELNTDARIKAFIKKTRESNPLNRENVATQMEMLTKDKDGKNKEVLHSLRMTEKKRTFFIKGDNSPVCMVTVGERDFKCNECTLLSNSQCRSYKSSEDSTTIRGTNIDTNDFDLLESEDFQSVCEDVPKNDKYIKIISRKTQGEALYDEIVSYYDKTKEVPIVNNYNAEGVLRKVYRFFPKYYILLKDEWVATITRVRTTKGSEKKYTFETLVKVLQNEDKSYQIYLDPKEDPMLKQANFNLLFNTK